MVKTEFVHGREDIEIYEPPIFETNKNNMPKNHSSPED